MAKDFRTFLQQLTAACPDDAVQDILPVIAQIKGNISPFKRCGGLCERYGIPPLTDKGEHARALWIDSKLPAAVENDTDSFVVVGKGELLAVSHGQAAPRG